MIPLFKINTMVNASVLRLEYDNSNMALGYKLLETSIFNIVSCPLLCLQSDCVVILICCSFQCQITSPQLLLFSFFLARGFKLVVGSSVGRLNEGSLILSLSLTSKNNPSSVPVAFYREPHSSFLNFLKQHSVICLYDKRLQIRSLLSLRKPLCLIFLSSL